MNEKELAKKAAQLRIDILKMIHKANSGHTGGSLSAIDIITALYYGGVDGEVLMKTDAKKPDFEHKTA